jgi:regulator of cell morphogenesis and NO signaling
VQQQKEITIRELALKVPGATRIFEELGIDYCCGGNRPLTEACAMAGLEVTQVERSLFNGNHSTEPINDQTLIEGRLAETISHILAKHHHFTRSEISRIYTLLDKVECAHGQKHPELSSIKATFHQLGEELKVHMMKEERFLFPYVIEMEEAITQQKPCLSPPFETVKTPVRTMQFEHDSAGELLKKIRTLASDFVCPPEVCLSYLSLYKGLEGLEKDLHQHIHLENNILFPKAVELETRVRDSQ